MRGVRNLEGGLYSPILRSARPTNTVTLREAGEPEIRWRGAIDDRRNDAGRNEGEGAAPRTFWFMTANGSGRSSHTHKSETLADRPNGE